MLYLGMDSPLNYILNTCTILTKHDISINQVQIYVNFLVVDVF